MGGFECVFVLIVFVAILVAIASHKQSSASGTNGAYVRLAARFGGTVSRGGWFRQPSVHFSWHGTQVLVDIYPSSGGPGSKRHTQVRMSWPESALKLEVYPAGMWSRMSRYLGMDDLQTGSPPFDRQFVVHSNLPDDALQFLSAGVQWHVDRLSRLLGSGDIYLSIDRGTLLVRKRSVIRDRAELEQYVRLCLELYEQAMLTQTAGIEFVDGPGPDGPPKCRVCGEEIVRDMVLCRRCTTPHHRDCWHYYGACAIYACGETRHIEPGLPHLSGPHNSRGSSHPHQSQG